MTKKELEEKIRKAENDLNELKSELEQLKEEPEFSRLPIGEVYFFASNYYGEFIPSSKNETGNILDEKFYNSNNYFYTRERANEVIDKIKLLLKMERMHDIYCPDYVPDWHSDDRKYYVYLYHEKNGEKFEISDIGSSEYSSTFFPNRKIAQKVCDILNEELKNMRDSNA